ncbi:MAG: FAD-binding protein [Bacteroidota bacterium]
MPTEVEITLLPEFAYSELHIRREAAKKLEIPLSSVTGIEIQKRSIDARRKPVRYLIRLQLFIHEPFTPVQREIHYPDVSTADSIHIVGGGPAGLFAALQAIELGLKPIVFERGKDVKSRRRDLAAINREHTVNPESNYCFGEGGAGTYSDGKLYTRSTKRGDVKKILDVLIHFGAKEDIRVDAHPHIGTNKLPAIISAMRSQIIASGGEVRFEEKVTDITVADGQITGVTINGKDNHAVSALILATGHSARDIFYLLHERNIRIEAKSFALGVRAEHPQSVIDACQYKMPERGEFLPPASYSLVEQVEGNGVFSFCMCPGGIIAPCATEQEEVVTNGWSPSKRNNPYANSGIVVTVDQQEFSRFGFEGPLAGLQYQQMIEKACWEAAGKTQAAPAQRMIDFVNGRKSATLPDCSYQPGIVSVKLDEILPKSISDRLKKAFVAFGTKMRGYYTNDAVLVAPESRTSSPVRIPRNTEDFMHPDIKGLIPCGEGAGYAGGIVSAAIDGENCAKKAALFLVER